MNSSLFTADRATHRRIVLTALAAATLVAIVGLGARGPISSGLAAAPLSTTRPAPGVVPPANSQPCNAAQSPAGCRLA